MNTMQYKTIDDIAFINPDSIKRGYPHNDIEYIDIASVGSGNLMQTTSIPLSEASSRAKRLVKNGDTILSTVRPNRRSFLYVKKPKDNIVVSTGFVVLRAKNGTDPRYLYYAVTDQKFTDYLTLSAKGAAYPAVDTEIVQRGKIPYWPTETQRKISAILAAYDDLIENNTRRIEVLEEIAQRNYREWFVDFRLPGYEKIKLIDSGMGKIPQGWQAKKIGEILQYHIGGGWGKDAIEEKHTVEAYVIRGTDIPDVKRNNISNCPLRFHTQSNFNSRNIENGDVIFEVSGGSKDQPVGRALLINQRILDAFGKPVICASFCKLMRIKREIISPELFYLKLLAIYEDRSIYKYQVQSTGISNFKFEYFLSNEMMICPADIVQKDFGSIVEPIFNEISLLGQKNMRLRETRDILLPKLVSGEVDVSEMNIARREQGNGA